MEDNLSETQRQEIIKKRQDMLKKMGVPNAGKVVMESIVSAGGAGASSVAARIAAIRNGSAKQELDKYISAKSGSDAGPASPNKSTGFQALPEPKIKKGPNQEVKPEYKQKLEDFGASASNNSELSSIEALFGGGGGSSSSTRVSNNSNDHQFQQNPVNMNLDIDSARMPTFNPHAALQKKLRETQGQTHTQEEFVPMQNNNMVAQPQFNVQQLQTMMETIAKGIAEKTIKNVLSEYSEQQKSKNYFEYYNKEKGVIKMADGKLYKLTQVQLKK